MICMLENISDNRVWEKCTSSAQVVWCVLGLKQALVRNEGVDRPELQWTINTLVGFSTAQITQRVREYLVRGNIKAISTIVIF